MGGKTLTFNILDVRAGGTYQATNGITYIDSTSYNRGTIQLPNGATIRGTTGNENFALYSDIDWDYGGAGSIVHLVGIVIVANADLTTGGAGVTVTLDAVNFSSAITDRIFTISESDTLQAISDSDTNLHVAIAVRGALEIDDGVEYNCENIDVYGIGEVHTPGLAYIDMRLGFTIYTMTFHAGRRMPLPVRLDNAVVRGDFYIDDIEQLGGCDVGVGYSY